MRQQTSFIFDLDGTLTDSVLPECLCVENCAGFRRHTFGHVANSQKNRYERRADAQDVSP
jgi:FMN phosphatase YigB (HAD superfamily)